MIATCPKCFAILRCDHPLASAAPWRCACCGVSFYVSFACQEKPPRVPALAQGDGHP